MAVQIVLATLEKLVFPNLQHDVDVAWRTSFSACIAFPGNSQLRLMIDTYGDFQFQRFFADHAAFSATCRTSILNDLPRAVALCAGPGDAEEPLLEAYLAISATGRTSAGARTLLRAASGALMAGFMSGYFDFLYCPEGGFFKCKTQ